MPFFKDVAIGCFVRVGIGAHEGRMVYRVRDIHSVTLFILCMVHVRIEQPAHKQKITSSNPTPGQQSFSKCLGLRNRVDYVEWSWSVLNSLTPVDCHRCVR